MTRPNASKPAYTPAPKPPYTGNGTEVVDNLTADTAPASRLLAIAAWHDRDWRGRERHGRHKRIAARLRQVAALVAATTVANDNAAVRAAA
ncbi:hypothetical protein CWR43_27910 [Rhizobium sullae]|uniref:Uncharacterized protein n=1 Tax=Rhizobium sullae TaxID=50338 RepID=A0A2N0D2Q7_RHISU|nr:hypothetical protein [Rhizobium sullae]PKA40410.1 hypothetical protein CWR43_27910 [Rhizobium sullae]